MSNDFDESILENEEEFKKRFRRIERPAFIDKVVKANKNRITIMLDPDVIEHFKTEAERSHTGYQTLINKTLRETMNAKTADPIEKLLKDKKALKRLKAKLESV
jgi:uncharacterized protein (DUF4415 family)